jgi:heat shock protein 4
MALLLSKINSSFERQGKTSRHYVFSVPTYTTLPERVAYVQAAKIAGLKPLRIISDSSATALAYAYQRRKELE